MNGPTQPMNLDTLQELLWSFASHRVLTVANETGLLRKLARGPASAEDAAQACGLDPAATAKVLRALHALGVTVDAGGGRYRLNDGLAPLFDGGPDDLGPFVAHSHDLYERWGAGLEPWLRGGELPPRPRTAESLHRFSSAMHAVGQHVATDVAAHLDLDRVRTVLDVGGGYGQYVQALRRRQPTLEATVLDRPEVAEPARAAIAGTEHEGHIQWVGGDYHTTDYGSGFDLVLLANVLHQELSEDAAGIVARAAAALAPGGTVAVVDFQIDDDQRQHLLGTLFAINMRSFGDTHPEPRIRSWMEAAGLGQITRTDLDSHRWLITGRAPE